MDKILAEGVAQKTPLIQEYRTECGNGGYREVPTVVANGIVISDDASIHAPQDSLRMRSGGGGG
jgi:hypothetical protein